MKNFILGGFCFAALCFSNTEKETDLLTVEPAMPKSVLVLTCGTTEATKYIKSYSKKGYKLKDYYINSRHSNNSILVMEKY